MGLFDKKEEAAQQAGEQPPQKEQAEKGQDKPEEKKTTPDEGKVFDKETDFVCVQDCYQNMTRYRRGQGITGKKCPPYFVVKPKEDEVKK